MTKISNLPLLSEDVRDFLKALVSETRQSILLLFVQHQVLTVGQVSEQLNIGQSTASEHLSLLKKAGVLSSNRVGKETYYRPNRKRMLELLQMFSDYLKSCCSNS
jgi:ArsR family transcriptional regulator, arsenate/arsenite/antimonite-responsive transcriptional repressor